MSRQFTIHVVTVCVAVLVPQAQAGRTDDLYIRYFKERRTLSLDTSRVAVFDDGSGQLAKSKNAQALRAAGLDIDGEKKSAIAGWTLVPAAAGRSDAEGIDTIVSTLAESKAADFVSPVFIGDDGGPLFVTSDILVKFADGTTRGQVNAVLASLNAGAIIDEQYGGIKNAFRVRSASRDGFAVLTVANRLAEREDVVLAEPDMIFTGRGSLIPNDPFFPSAWGLHNTGQSGGLLDFDMDAPEAWDVTIGDPSILVVIIDNGVQQNHPDINQIPGTDVTTDASTTGGPANICDNHGTPVAGCVSGTINNNTGAVGVAPGCRSASVRTFISNMPCDGNWTTQISSTVTALAWAESIGARVTNNSNGYGFQSAAIAQKYTDTRAAGMIHFASAGNDNSGTLSYPSSLSSVNSIGALNRFGGRASFSNFNFQIAFSAPGQDIVTADRTGGDGYAGGDVASVNGTSFASPYTAGVAALILSIDPSRSAFDVEDILRETAVNMGSPGFFGAGRPNAFNAVTYEPCISGAPATAEASPLAKNRYISFVPGVPDEGRTAIRVRLVGLMDPVPPYPDCCPAPDFSAFNGESRWVASLGECPDSASQGTSFKCATLQCTPVYDNWERILPGETLHVTGDSVVPSSNYEVAQILEGCDVADEVNYTVALPIRTARWGDVALDYHDPLQPGPATQPNISDVVGIVDALKDVSGRVSVPVAQLNGESPDPAAGLNVFDVTLAVDAIKLSPFPFAGPVPCQ
jgi:Subtilase family